MVAGKRAAGPVLDIGKLTGMFWAVAVFGLGGLSLFVGGLLGMVAMGVDSEKLTILAAFSILTILVISVLLIIQLSRLVSTVIGSAGAASIGKQRPIEVDSPPQIDSPPLSMPSVTEHTTRSFDKASHKDQRASG
jgi:hypothetical protein